MIVSKMGNYKNTNPAMSMPLVCRITWPCLRRPSAPKASCARKMTTGWKSR